MRMKNLFFAAALLGSSAAMADVYEASFEGNWYDPAQSGRGVNIDYVPQDLGNGTYYIISFTYDNQGNPTWLQYLASGREGQRLFKNVDVFRVSGGTSGQTFPPASALVIAKVGTATIDMASCSKVSIDFTPSGGGNVPALKQVVTRLDSPGVGAPGCPFVQEFSACPTGTTAVEGQDRVCELPAGNLVGDIRLTNTATYRLGGRVAIGAGMDLTTGNLLGATGRLFVEPGTIVRGNASSASRLIINPGSKIFAEGTPVAPVVFTGNVEIPDAQLSPGAWAGLIIGGRAPINAACTGGQTNTRCAFEADSAVVWGGSDANDSSGVLRYVQIRSAGGIVTGSIDLNALTLGAVGAGTVIDYVQTYRSTDDGFEMFGGTVNLRHIVAVGNNDDNIDTDFGYTGKIQYAYVKMSEGIDPADSHGIESDNTSGSPFVPDSLPRTRPQLVNATFDGGGVGVDGIRIRRGSAFVIQNTVVYGFKTCLNFNDKATYDATFASGQFNGTTQITGTFFSCDKLVDDQTADPFLLSAFLTAQGNNTSAATTTGLFSAKGRTLAPGSVLRNSEVFNADAYFDRYATKGAFVDGDWTQGWTIGL